MGRGRDVPFNEAAWERYLNAERREVELRRNGILGRLLVRPLPGESAAELERTVQDDQQKAEQGLVRLKRGDRVWWKHVEELIPGDRAARAEAEAELHEWLAERRRRRTFGVE